MQQDAQAQPDAQTETRRVTVAEAAQLLNTTVEGVRSRIKRGSLDSMRVSGTVYVLLQPHQVERGDQTSPGAQTRPDDQMSPGDWFSPVDALQQLVDEQRNQLDWFRREVERKDTIIMQMAQRIPELEPAREAPPEPREEPETASPEMEGVEVPLAEEKPQRSFWQKLFGT